MLLKSLVITGLILGIGLVTLVFTAQTSAQGVPPVPTHGGGGGPPGGGGGGGGFKLWQGTTSQGHAINFDMFISVSSPTEPSITNWTIFFDVTCPDGHTAVMGMSFPTEQIQGASFGNPFAYSNRTHNSFFRWRGRIDPFLSKGVAEVIYEGLPGHPGKCSSGLVEWRAD